MLNRTIRVVGTAAAADIEPNDTYPETKRTIANTESAMSKSIGATPMSIPAAVLMPLPPLNCAKIDQTCPTIALNPAIS